MTKYTVKVEPYQEEPEISQDFDSLEDAVKFANSIVRPANCQILPSIWQGQNHIATRASAKMPDGTWVMGWRKQLHGVTWFTTGHVLSEFYSDGDPLS